MHRYLVAIKAGPNNDNVPENWYVSATYLSNDLLSEPPTLPVEYQNNALADIVTEQEFKNNQNTHKAGFEASNVAINLRIADQKSLMPGRVDIIKSNKINKGVELSPGKWMPLTGENISYLTVLADNYQALSYPSTYYVNSDTQVTFTTSGELLAAKSAALISLLGINITAAGLITQINNCTTQAEIDSCVSGINTWAQE